jgi:hypothetical protein
MSVVDERNMRMEYWWHDTDGELGEKPFPILACSPQISLGLGLD